MFHTHVEYLYEYEIFQMGMKKAKQSRENHTHLGYSILIENIIYEYGIFQMGMKKGK
jgi:hypothetical protein